MSIRIVSVTENDWRVLKSVRLSSLKENPEAFGMSYQDAKSYTEHDWRLRASGVEGPHFIIAYKDKEAIGLVGGISIDDEYELISMWVAPEFRGQGVGKKLIDALKQSANNRGFNAIMLKVSPCNISACNLYTKCGFSIVGNDSVLASNDSVTLSTMLWFKDAYL